VKALSSSPCTAKKKKERKREREKKRTQTTTTNVGEDVGKKNSGVPSVHSSAGLGQHHWSPSLQVGLHITISIISRRFNLISTNLPFST
jgi:hypothetical protein